MPSARFTVRSRSPRVLADGSDDRESSYVRLPQIIRLAICGIALGRCICILAMLRLSSTCSIFCAESDFFQPRRFRRAR